MVFKSEEKIFNIRDTVLEDGTSFPVLTFAVWDALPGIRHCFSTRAGGVSEGFLSSLNFRGDLYDPPENILENYRRAALFFGTTPDRIVCAQQTHTANVRIVTEEDAGKGVVRERDYRDVDALATNVPGLVLFTSHADCPPLYFYDPVRRVIALAHSGWKGTVSRIGEAALRKMKEAFGTDPANVYAAVGPSICPDCYEISEEVAREFRACFSRDAGRSGDAVLQDAGGSPEESCTPGGPAEKSQTGAEKSEECGDVVLQDAGGSPEESRLPDGPAEKMQTEAAEPAEHGGVIPRILKRGRRPGHYQLDLWKANERILLEAGIKREHLTVTNLCTCCNCGELFSHRATGGRRGNQGAFLMLDA